MGINYYWTNQWEWRIEPLPNGKIPPLADDDPRRVPLNELVRAVWERYGGDVMITETSHVGDMRGPWLRTVAAECEMLLEEGVPVCGVCLYPILGMPEWHSPEEWTPMGLWDPISHAEPRGERIACRPMLDAFRETRRLDELHATALAQRAEALDAGRRRKRRRAGSDDALQFAAE